MSNSHILYLVPVNKRRIFRDAATATSAAQFSSVNFNVSADTTTLQSVAQISAVAIYSSAGDSATIFSIAQPSAIESRTYTPDSAMVTSVSAVSTADQAAYVDANTVTSIAAFVTDDIGNSHIFDAATVTSVAVVSAAEVTTYVSESTVVTGVAAPSASVITTYVNEAATVTSTAVISAPDLAAYTDPAPGAIINVTSVAVMSGTDSAAWNPDAATVIAAAAPSDTDEHDYPADAATITSVFASQSLADLQPQTFLLLDNNRELQPNADLLDAVDAGTPTSVAAPSAADTKQTSDSGTITSAASISSPTIDQFVKFLGSGSTGQVTTFSAPISTSTSVGDFVMLAWGVTNNSTVATVSDSKGNTWHIDITETAAGAASAIATTSTDVAGLVAGTDTITFTSGTSIIQRYMIRNFGNVMTASPLDQSSSRVVTSSSPQSTATGTTTQAKEIAVMVSTVSTAVTGDTFPGGTDPNTGGQWTNQLIILNAAQSHDLVMFDQYLTATSSVRGAYTCLSSSAEHAIVVATYKLK